MVDVKIRECKTPGCCKWPTFGMAGARTAKFCAQHAPNGMIDVC
ncbi:unnamed protein product, partial [Ascophyllum nodosum]